MASIFDKLNLKQQTEIVVLGAPPSFEPELASLQGVQVRRDLPSVTAIEFSLAFVTTQKEVDRLAPAVAKKAKEDAVVWFAYPKGTSKKYKSEINRDKGWAALGSSGFEPVRQVAIDEDWSATRFRRIEFIKNMTRDPQYLLSRGAKAQLAKK